MGTFASDLDDVRQLVEAVPETGAVFAFFAFDERPSQRPVLDFLTGAMNWIDDLSATAGIRTVIPAKKFSTMVDPPSWMGAERPLRVEEAAALESWPRKMVYRNPSVDIAHEFGVRPTDLPGIIFFAALHKGDVRKSLFVPLNIVAFDSHATAEAAVASLFARVGDALRECDDDSERRLEAIQCAVSQAKANTVEPEKDFGHVLRRAGHAPTKDIPSIMGWSEDPFFRALPPRKDRTKTRIFVSYAREDSVCAERIFDAFDDLGFDPWLDQRSILPGENWQMATLAAIRRADFFVACLSAQSIAKRGYVQREYREALAEWQLRPEGDIYLIPVLLDECEVPASLGAFH